MEDGYTHCRDVTHTLHSVTDANKHVTTQTHELQTQKLSKETMFPSSFEVEIFVQCLHLYLCLLNMFPPNPSLSGATAHHQHVMTRLDVIATRQINLLLQSNTLSNYKGLYSVLFYLILKRQELKPSV